MGIFIGWIFLSFIIAFIGRDRKIGYGGTFILSLLLSPIIGAIFALASQRVQTTTVKVLTPDATELYREGERYFFNKKYDSAIELFKEALKYNPKSKNIFIKLAQCYSRKEDSKTCLYYIHRAVDSGFSDFKFIQKDSSFKFIRQQNEFNEFAKNGYRLKEEVILPEIEKNTNQSNNTISQLEKLATLKEKGVLTEEEFQIEKQKILNG